MEKLSNLEEKTINPDFWKNNSEAQNILKKIKSVKDWINGYNNAESLCEELEITYDYFKNGEVEEKELKICYIKANKSIENLEFKNML